MRNNDGNSILKPEDWIGYGYLVLFLAIIINMGCIFVWDFDYMAAIGIVISTKYKLFVFALFAVICFVNLKHDDSDRIWNFGLFIGFLAVLAGINLGVSIDASKAGDKMAQAAAQAKNNATTHVQSVQQHRPQQAQQAAPAPVVRQAANSWYNVYLQNKQSGSNYKWCATLLKNGDINTYRTQKCNTGAPIAKKNIATCQKWQREGTLTKYQTEGCGFQPISQKAAWCQLNVGQKGQNRSNYCK